MYISKKETTEAQMITKAQANALALIEDNPNRVEAVTRVAKGMLRINGNVEHSLSYAGLVERVDLGEHTRTAYGNQVTVMIRAWKLTEAGRVCLRHSRLG